VPNDSAVAISGHRGSRHGTLKRLWITLWMEKADTVDKVVGKSTHQGTPTGPTAAAAAHPSRGRGLRTVVMVTATVPCEGAGWLPMYQSLSSR